MSHLHGCALAIVALILAAGCSSGGSSGGGGTPITVHGSGVLAVEARAVSGFVRVTHFSEGALFIEEAIPTPLPNVTRSVRTDDRSLRTEVRLQPIALAAESLVVSAEDNLLPYILTTVNNGTLALRTAPNVDLEPTLPIEFFVEVIALEGVELEGIGSILVSDLTTQQFDVTQSGIGTVELANLTASELDVVLTGIGQIRASGVVDRQTVELAGIGPYEAENLSSLEADVLVARSDSATVRVSDVLIATVESSGSVFYYGNPTVFATITGTGDVTRLGP